MSCFRVEIDFFYYGAKCEDEIEEKMRSFLKDNGMTLRDGLVVYRLIG